MDEGRLVEYEEVAGDELVGEELRLLAETRGFHMHDDVAALQAMGVLRRDIEKARAYRFFPFYIVLLIIVTTIPWMSRLSNSRYNELFHLEKANQQELELSKFMSITDAASFWNWYEVLAKQILDLGTGNRLAQMSNHPVGYLLLRQFRVKPAKCWTPSVIARSLKGKIPDTCYGEWDIGDMSTEPYGPKNTTWTIGRGISVLAVTTMFHTYPESEDAFSIIMPLSMARDEVLSNITYLRDNGWVDQATRVVIIDVLTFNPAIDAFALNHFFLEFFATGSTVAGSKAYPFDLLRFDSNSRRFLFVADVTLSLGTTILLVGLIWGIYQRHQLGTPAWQIQPFEVFDGGLIVFLVHATVYRMLLWRDGPELHDGDVPDDEMEMYISLFEYGFNFERANTYVGIAVVFAWLRLFKFLQYNNRLGVLSETARRAASDLVAMFLIFFIVLVGFGIGGSALFGVDHKNFSSWWLAMAYLLRLLISAEVDTHYDELKAIHPDWTGLYLASYIIITWVILMNMILAIITGAFVASQENMNMSSEGDGFSFANLKKDTRNLLKRMFPCFGDTNHARYCETRIGVVIWLNRFVEERRIPGVRRSKEVRITLEEWVKGTANYLPPEQCLRVFERARKKGDVDRNHMKVGQRFANTTTGKLDAVQESLAAVRAQLEMAEFHTGAAAVTSPVPTEDTPSPQSSPAKKKKGRRGDLHPAPELSFSREQHMERRRNREQDLRAAAASVLSESGAPSSPSNVPWRGIENTSMRFVTDNESSQSSIAKTKCMSPGCSNACDTDLNDVSQDYCTGHLCHRCHGPKRPPQSVCDTCNADVSTYGFGNRTSSTPLLRRGASASGMRASNSLSPMPPYRRTGSMSASNPLGPGYLVH